MIFKSDQQYQTISSLHNPVVKLIHALDRRRIRRASGLFVAEGLKVVATARDRGWIPRIFLTRAKAFLASRIEQELADWAVLHNATCLEVSGSAFEKVTARNNPQDIIAVFTQRWITPTTALPVQTSVWIALEAIRDPGNLGTIVRTADATGVDGVVLVGACCDPYSREAVRATMGSIFNVSLSRMSLSDFQEWRSTWPGEVVGAHLSSGIDFHQCYQTPTLLVMGSEGPGLSPVMAGICTQLVRIPMIGHTDSLNLSVATALMLYEIRREYFLSLPGVRLFKNVKTT